MQVAGVHWSDPTSKAFRFFRQTATGADARGKSSPLRPIWHYNDQSGTPADDARVAEGDLLVYDDGSGSRLLMGAKNVGGVRSFYGFGVRADNRTTATSGAGARQASDLVKLRGQLYTGGAAKNRDFWLRVEPSVDSGNEYTMINFWWRQQEAAADLDMMTLYHNHTWTGGKFDSSTLALRDQSAASGPAVTDSFVAGLRMIPGFSNATSVTRHNYLDLNDVALAGGSTVTDACLVRFDAAAGTHKALDAATGGAHAWLKHNEAGTIRYEPWFDSKQLEARWSTAATVGTPTQDSGDFRWRGSYYTPSGAFSAYAYSRLVMDDVDPLGHWELGFDFGSGTFQLYQDGNAWLRVNGLAGLWLSQAGEASFDDQMFGSAGLVHRGTSWDGAAAVDRGTIQGLDITSSAAADDEWMLQWLSIEDFSLLMGLDQSGRIVLGENSDAAFRLDAALGTHPATTNADKTGNTKTGTLKVVDASGTILGHIQLYADA
jgi:hypothetical protein